MKNRSFRMAILVLPALKREGSGARTCEAARMFLSGCWFIWVRCACRCRRDNSSAKEPRAVCKASRESLVTWLQFWTAVLMRIAGEDACERKCQVASTVTLILSRQSKQLASATDC
jgi:hypothetical protein